MDSQIVEYTICELSRMFDVSYRTLRFYEQRLLLQPRRCGPARYYSAKDKVRLEIILTGKRLGFTLTEIGKLIDSRANEIGSDGAHFTACLSENEIVKRIDLLTQKRDTVDEAIGELRRAMAA